MPRPTPEIPPETEQCEACHGSGKNKPPFKGKCFRCGGAKKLTKKQLSHARWCSKLLDKTLGANDEAD